MKSVCSIYRTVGPFGISDKQIRLVVDRVFVVLKKKPYLASVHIVGDRRMRSLNRQYRGIDKSTDVLSFAAQEGIIFPSRIIDWGDIFISAKYIVRQAKRFDVPFREEFFRMLVHGVLHLLGYDHLKDRDAKKNVFFAGKDINGSFMKIKRLFKSFFDAYRGLSYVWRREQNLRFQLFAGLFVIGLGFGFDIRRSEFLVLLLLILLVLILEILNSAMEHFIDIIKPRMSHHAALIKDILAAAVLCASLGAGIIGIVIFWPYFSVLF